MTEPVAITGWAPMPGVRQGYSTGVRGGSRLTAECMPAVAYREYAWRVVLWDARRSLADQPRKQVLRSGLARTRKLAREQAERALCAMVAAERATAAGGQRLNIYV